MLCALLAIVLQADTVVQTRVFEMLVPSGWKASETRAAMLEHTSGASFRASRVQGRGRPIAEFARAGVEQVWLPLGFVTVGEPLSRRVRNRAAVQFEVRGSRLGERRRIQYIAIDRGQEFFELIYENSEESFDRLLGEVERIASSVVPVTEANEGRAIAALRTLNTAEVRYFAAYKRYGTLADVIAQGLAGANLAGEHNGYRFHVTVTSEGYVAEAIPVRTGQTGRFAFRSSRDGVVRYSESRRLAPVGLAGRPVQD